MHLYVHSVASGPEKTSAGRRGGAALLRMSRLQHAEEGGRGWDRDCLEGTQREQGVGAATTTSACPTAASGKFDGPLAKSRVGQQESTASGTEERRLFAVLSRHLGMTHH